MSAIISHLFAIFIRLGGFGLLILGVLDSSFLFTPFGNDLLIVALTARERHMLPIFAAMATAGSVLGCLLVDWASRKGGEEGLEKIVSGRRLGYVKRKVRNSAAWALALASVMPPPFPFTPIVAAAAAFQYPRKKLLSVIAVFRFIRFLGEGLLAIAFGPQILRLAETLGAQIAILVFVAICIVGSVLTIRSRFKKGKKAS
jgi:membrane protein YqaA with SNARE-associated domain